jgi:hypothetical protein
MIHDQLRRVGALFSAWSLLILLSGCERSTEVFFLLDNASSHEVLVRGTDLFRSEEISINLLPGEKREISRMHFWGIHEAHIAPTESLGTDLSIANAHGDTLMKDYRVASLWLSEWMSHGWTATRNYVLILEEGDFAP